MAETTQVWSPQPCAVPVCPLCYHWTGEQHRASTKQHLCMEKGPTNWSFSPACATIRLADHKSCQYRPTLQTKGQTPPLRGQEMLEKGRTG